MASPLRLEMEEASPLPIRQALHNFRVRNLMEHDTAGEVAFCETTDRILRGHGVRTGSSAWMTHVMSNIAVLTRLGLRLRDGPAVPVSG